MLLKSQIEQAYLLQQKIRIQKTGKIIERQQLKKLSLDNNFIQVISGIRRCGKSTLLHQLMNNYSEVAYFNFEDPRVLNFEVSDFAKLEEVIDENTSVYFFDEIQNVPKWELYIRQLRDNEKKVFITGSNASLLSKDLGTRLTGRYLNTELFPFSFVEYLDFTGQNNSVSGFEQFLQNGGFPEYLQVRQAEVLQNLLKDIVLRDIAIRYNIKNTKTLLDIALYLISNMGKETTYNSLKKTFDVGSANTIMDYLSWMEDAYLLFFLQKFNWSAKSRAVNPRKVYAIDTGFIKANSLSFNSDFGRLLENAVYIHFRSNGIKMYYFREKSECDFVLFNGNDCKYAVQVCYDLNSDNQQREIRGLMEALNFFKIEEGYILTLSQKDSLSIDGKKIRIVPANEFLSDNSFLSGIGIH